MTNGKCLIMFVSMLLLAGCGGGGGDASVPSGANQTSIGSFVVTGTSPEVNGVIPIDANINGGQFKVEWNVSSSDPYHIDLYISEDATLSKTDDIKFFGKNCGSLGGVYECSARGSFDCKFTTQNKISCGTVSAANPEKDITSFLDAIPKAAYLIFEACNGLLTSCEVSTKRVELQ